VTSPDAVIGSYCRHGRARETYNALFYAAPDAASIGHRA